MKPSNFTDFPMDSETQNTETEILARNIMKILKRTGDTWRQLSLDEYIAERKKDGGFSRMEEHYFEKALPYTINEKNAKSFSKNWGNAK